MKRGRSSPFFLRSLILPFVLSPGHYTGAELGGVPAIDTGWARYCRTCRYLDRTSSAGLPAKGVCRPKGHSDTEILKSYTCTKCKKELLYRKGKGPRRKTITCGDGDHDPTPAWTRETGDSGVVTILEP